MSNVVQIKRGNGKPDGKLAPYELGFDTSTQQLYIGGPFTEDNQYGNAILINSAGVNLETVTMKTTLMKKGASKKDNQILQIYCEGLVPGRKYTILLYTMQKSRGNTSRYWRHPSNTIPEGDLNTVIGKFTGYANIVGNSTIPEWMERKGVLQTEWELIPEKTSEIYEICLNTWIKDLLKPVQVDGAIQWNLIGIANKKQTSVSRLFQFRIQDNETGIIGEPTNFLTLSSVNLTPNIDEEGNEIFRPVIEYFSIKN